MTAQLTKIKNTAGVQAVLNAGFGAGPAIVTKNFRQLGINVPLYQSHGVASKEFIKLAGDAAEGVRLPAAAVLVAEALPAGDQQKPVVVGYKKAYEARFKSGRLDLRRPRLRRPDARGGGDEEGRLAPTRPRCATRSRPPRATSAPAAW